jgi:hypothetical protein
MSLLVDVLVEFCKTVDKDDEEEKRLRAPKRRKASGGQTTNFRYISYQTFIAFSPIISQCLDEQIGCPVRDLLGSVGPTRYPPQDLLFTPSCFIKLTWTALKSTYATISCIKTTNNIFLCIWNFISILPFHIYVALRKVKRSTSIKLFITVLLLISFVSILARVSS